MTALPVWAVAAPRRYTDAALREAGKLRDDGLDDVETVDGAASVAIVSRRPGTEGLDARLARAISSHIPEEVILLRFGEDLEAALRYRHGRRVGAAESGPVETAAELGLPLRDSPPAEPVRSVIAIEGANAAAVRAALDVGEDGPLHTVETPCETTLLWNEQASVAGLVRPLSRAIPDASIHLLLAWSDRHELDWTVVRGGRDIGVPDRDAPPEDRLRATDLRGVHDPESAARALCVPPELLWSAG